MATPPTDSHDAFLRLLPELKGISTAISDSGLPARERTALANMVVGYFVGLASEKRRADLHVVSGVQQDEAS